MGLELESLVKLVGHTQLSKTGIAMKFVVVQSLSCVRLFVTPTDCSMPGSSVLHYLPEFAQIHVH